MAGGFGQFAGSHQLLVLSVTLLQALEHVLLKHLQGAVDGPVRVDDRDVVGDPDAAMDVGLVPAHPTHELVESLAGQAVLAESAVLPAGQRLEIFAALGHHQFALTKEVPSPRLVEQQQGILAAAHHRALVQLPTAEGHQVLDARGFGRVADRHEVRESRAADAEEVAV